MTGPAEQHVFEMLTLASRRHREAIEAIEARPIDIERARAADGHLADAELLVQDCLDLTGDLRLEVALDQLRDQRRMLAEGLARFDAIAAMPKPASVWATPWPWLSLMLIAVALATQFV